MSLLFTDSFDHYGTNHLPAKGWTPSGSEVVIDSSGGREGGQALRLNAGSGVEVGRAVTPSDTLILGCSLFLSANPESAHPLVSFLANGTLQCVLERNSDGTVTFKRGGTALATSPVALASGGYGYLEISLTVHSAQGSYAVRWNEATIIYGTGVSTQVGDLSVITEVRLGIGASGGHLRIDDFYLLDNQGFTNNQFLGDVEVQALYPTGDGAFNDFFGPDDEGPRYPQVSEPVLDSNSYLSSSQGNRNQSFTFGAPDEDVDVIVALQSVAALRRVGAVQSFASALAYDTFSQLTLLGLPQEVLSTLKFFITTYDFHPALGEPWNLDSLSKFEFGLRHDLSSQEI